MLDSVKKHHEI